MKKLSDIVMVVPSCDKYKELWKPFFVLLKKYWPDCPFKIYLISENPNYPGVEGIAKKDEGWATNMKRALEKIKEPYILLIIEDFLLSRKVNTQKVLELFEIMKKENICHLGLTPFLRRVYFPQFRNYPDLIEVRKDSLGEKVNNRQNFYWLHYRVTTQAGIWNKEIFNKILREGEDIWETELIGTSRSYQFEPFVMMKDESVIKYVNCVDKCKITEEGRKYLEDNNFKADIKL